MAASTLALWAEYLFEMQGTVHSVYSSDHPWLAELNGFDRTTEKAGGRFTRDMADNRTTFSGSKVRHTIDPYGLQGGGWVAENGTWNVPIAPIADQAELNLKRFLQPIALTVDVERDSLNNSNAKAVARHVMKAREATANKENVTFLGDGTGLMVDITDGATSLTTTCGTTANFDVLLPGTVWDILTRATGADPGQGKRRKIVSVNETTRVITWSTTQQASDGGSGNIVHTSADGIYIPGTYGNAAQGLDQAVAATGTFETIDKGANAFWQGTDGRAGDTDVLPLSDSMLDGGVRRGRRWGVGKWDFGIGDPAAIDIYKQSKLSLVNYGSQESTIKSGFKGIVYDGADQPIPLIKEPAHKKGSVRFVRKDDFILYGDDQGPSFLQDDGSMWRRFARQLEKEADLLDRVELGVVSCNSIVTYDNLSVS